MKTIINKSKILFLLLIAVVFFIQNINAKENISPLPERYLGNADAPNIIIEYASLSCVHCANFHIQNFDAIKEKYIDTGKVKFIFRDFPLDLPAMIASMVSQCQSNEGYFSVLTTLFKNQKLWAPSKDVKKSIAKVLKQYGIDDEDIESCVTENETNTKRWKAILDSRVKGQELGVSSTPAFFVNNKKIQGTLDISILSKIID